jgi:hypothetical protein
VSPDNLTWAFLFLVIVAVMVVVGIIVGMIVAGGLDRIQAPRPPAMVDEPAVADPAVDPAPDAVRTSPHHAVEEDVQP